MTEETPEQARERRLQADRERLRPACERFLREHLESVRNAARDLGYAIAIHGSLVRDVDLIAAPWIEDAASPEDLIAAVMATMERCHITGKADEKRPHGRRVWSIWFDGVDGSYLDISVMPAHGRKKALEEARDLTCEACADSRPHTLCPALRIRALLEEIP